MTTKYRLKDSGLEQAIMRVVDAPQDTVRAVLHAAVVDANERGLVYADARFLTTTAGVRAVFTICVKDFEEYEAYDPIGWNDVSLVELPPDTDFVVRLSTNKGDSAYAVGRTNRRSVLRIGTDISFNPETRRITQTYMTLAKKPPEARRVCVREIEALK